jgi:hypothetical protein
MKNSDVLIGWHVNDGGKGSGYHGHGGGTGGPGNPGGSRPAGLRGPGGSSLSSREIELRDMESNVVSLATGSSFMCKLAPQGTTIKTKSGESYKKTVKTGDDFEHAWQRKSDKKMFSSRELDHNVVTKQMGKPINAEIEVTRYPGLTKSQINRAIKEYLRYDALTPAEKGWNVAGKYLGPKNDPNTGKFSY